METEKEKKVCIAMGYTVYRRYEAQKKRDVKIAYQNMSAEERESFMPANITPVYNIY